MIVYSLLIFSILFAAFCIYMIGRRSTSGLLLAVAGAIFIYLYGAWVFLSVYVKYVFAACFIATMLYRFMSSKRGERRISTGKTVANILCTMIFMALSILYFTGTTGEPYGVAHLQLPFRQGRYFVFQGGEGLPTNVFHYKLRGAVYAMDLVKLNMAGNRASRIFSTNLKDYEIYGDTLYSPCNAIVAHVNEGNPDNIPPMRKRGPTNTNFILLETNDMYVFMGHLKPNSVLVQDGDTVRAGQPIAVCGNSGFSLEPHLHIQAHARTDESIPWYKEKPLLIKFNNRFYRLFEEINVGL